ncbi:MAG: ABC transporter substrate-binding protein [Cyanobacteria bacterium J06642_2]
MLTRRTLLGAFSFAATTFLVASFAPDSEAAEKLRVGYQTGDINNVTMVAYNEGFFEEVGLEVELVPYASGGSMVPALAAGEVDVTWFFPFPSLSAYARGIPIEVFLLDHSPKTAERLIGDFESVEELEGKKIGVTFGTSGHHSLLSALNQSGLTEEDVTLVNLKPAEMAPAYGANQIDAAWTWEPAAGKLNELGGKDIATADSVGAFAVALWAVRTEFAEESPEQLQKFIAAWDKAQQHYLEDPSAGQAWEAERLNLSAGDFAAMVDRQGSEVLLLEDQLTNDWLGEPGQASDTSLFNAYEDYAVFLEEQGRIDSAPEDIAPLINAAYLKDYVESK